jgi:uncharacterized protein involved in type VI secretion and phage assembly
VTATFDFGLEAREPDDQRIYGVAPAMVIGNIDTTGEARVQVSLPWLPGVTPWARIATPMAGMGRGFYFVPQIGDEVLVAFNQGDIREPYVIGALWNTTDRPPALLPTDPVTKRIIRSPLGQEIVLDDTKLSVKLDNEVGMTVEIDATSAVVSAPGGSVKVELGGKVTVTALRELTLQGNIININGGRVRIRGTVGTEINGGPECVIRGGVVRIN